MSQQTKLFYEFGPFRLEPAERLLLRSGEVVPLTPKAFDLLLALVRNHGHLLDKDELMKLVWPDAFVEEANLSYTVSLIRKALGENGDGQPYVETVPKRGYRFMAEVKEQHGVGTKPAVEESVTPVGEGEMPPAALSLGSAASQANPSRLATAAALPAVTESQAKARGPRFLDRERLAWIVAAGILLLGLLASLPFTIAYLRHAPVNERVVRSFIFPPEKSSFNFSGRNGAAIALSPDGRRLAFVAPSVEGRVLLWVRPLDALSAQPLAGTEGAAYPFWSPDSRFLGFFVQGKLKKIDASGGPPLTLCDAPLGRGGTWNRDGVIVFAPKTGELHRVSASGGASSPVTKLDETQGETSHRWPCFLPDGEHFLYLRWSGTASETAAIYVASLASHERKLLLHVDSNVEYAQGYLLYLRERTLMAQPFDATHLETAGGAFPIAEQIQSLLGLTRGVFSVSEQGVLAYHTGAGASGSQLTWFDRSGQPQGELGDPAPYSSPQLSPDGKRAAVIIHDPQTRRPDIWLIDVARGLRTRFTFDPAEERVIAWSPDGNRIVFNANRKSHFDIYQKAASGAGSDELLLESNLDKYPTSFSPDGRFLLYYTSGDPKTKTDLWVLPLEGDRKPFPFLQTEFSESGCQFSPDGRWVAYNSDESGRFEIYVAPFPGPSGKRQVSTSGGIEPRWRGDGKEIFYLSSDNKLMAAEVNGLGVRVEGGAVRPLFEIRPSGLGYFYDVTADGERFLVNTVVEQKAAAPITLVQNWTAELKK